MTSQEFSRRKIAVKAADAINKIEGVPVSNDAIRLSHQWANGELTGIEMKAALLAKHTKTNAVQESRL
jgi:hypothetical protein